MSYLLSVIVPVYNVEHYLDECLGAIVNQSIGIDNIEVILIDDHSSDNSLKIAERYAKRYKTIKIVRHPKNMGSGSARNTGLNMATSELITFIDGDDFVTGNTLELAVECMKRNNLDLFIYEYEYFSSSNKVYPRNPSAILFSENKIITDICDFPEIIFATSVCNKVFKKDLINDLRFAESRIEDVMFSTQTTFHARNIYVCNDCKYYYRKREESNSKTDEYYSNKESYWDHLNVNRQMCELVVHFPEYKKLIDWFNARSLHPFIYNMVNKQFFTLQEKRDFFYESKRVLANIDSGIIEKLEKTVSKTIVKNTQKKTFSLFYSTNFFMKLYNGIISGIPGGQKIKKAAFLVFCIVVAFLFRMNKKYKYAWLICERGYEARDNGYSFFKYLREKHQGINAYYLMDLANHRDLKKVKSLGNVVQYGGFKHKILFILAKYLVTAHRGTIEPWNYQQYSKYFGFISKQQKYIFLQHGITKDDVSNVLGKAHTSFDLFITGAKPEYEYIKSSFGYTNGEVVYTGFARFDDLHQIQTKKQILFMPTWRKKLAWSASLNKSESFKQSYYFRRFQSFLNNEGLIEILTDHDYELIFYPHHEMQQFIDCFSTRSKRIVIASEHEYDVQTLLRESEVLITDYSSVFFDFGYMGKPILYYQFDSEDFFQTHYKQGYFSYVHDGFGPVLREEQEIVDYIKWLMNSNNQLEESYRQRIDHFFLLKDRNNCERIYKSIIELK